MSAANVSRALCLFLLGFLAAPQAPAQERVLRLYHDADWGNHIESAESIWRGVSVALAEADHEIQGYRIELVKKNHGGNVVRSLTNIEQFLADDSALAVISGIHSPPLINNRNFINKNGVLTLVPWAAGGPITRYPNPENWIFRLSIDDTKAGERLTSYALKEKDCKKPHLLLEDTPWGDSNHRNMRTAMSAHNVQEFGVTRFSWGIKGHSARGITSRIIADGADCILLVANAVEGEQFAEAMLAMPSATRLPIISHWGITAGDFHEVITADKRAGLDLTFIQTCFSFMQEPLSEKGQQVFAAAREQFPYRIREPRDIRSPVGFIHGYDLTRLLIEAINAVTLTPDMPSNRRNVREALENLQQPVVGLIKTYVDPFDVFVEANQDAHEALGPEDFCMASYNDRDDIILK